MGGSPTSPPVLVWIDLETTGLEPQLDRILEVGVVITDHDLRSQWTKGFVLGCPSELLGVMEPFVRQMHTDSGLLDEAKNSTLTVEEVEAELLDVVSSWPAKSVPLFGSTVHFDRAFMKAWMPRFEAWFHYRNGDVSAVQELINIWLPEIVQRSPRPREIHRALPDLQDSIDKASYYRRFMLERSPARGGW